MRTVPPCIPRQWGPLAVEEVSVWILQYLPVYTADVIVWLFYRLYRMIRGNSRNKKGRILGGKINPDWYPFSSHRVPPIDKGGFTEALGEGKVLLHSCIAEAKGRKIMFQSNPGSGSREGHTVEDSLDTDVIVLCTGYRADWSWLHIPLPLSLPLSLPLPLPLLRSTVTAIIPSPPMSSLPQNTLSYHGEVKTLDRDSVLSEFARLRSLSPITCTDGLFFIGYDPGPALIPLSAIRNQAKIIAKTARKLLFSEFKSVTVK